MSTSFTASDVRVRLGIPEGQSFSDYLAQLEAEENKPRATAPAAPVSPPTPAAPVVPTPAAPVVPPPAVPEPDDFVPVVEEKDDFTPAPEFLPQEELRRQIDAGIFDPKQYAADFKRNTGREPASLPAEAFENLFQAYRYSRERGVTPKAGIQAAKQLLPMAGDVVRSGWDVAKGFGNVIGGLSKGDVGRAKKASAEFTAALEKASVDNAELARVGVRKSLAEAKGKAIQFGKNVAGAFSGDPESVRGLAQTAQALPIGPAAFFAVPGGVKNLSDEELRQQFITDYSHLEQQGDVSRGQGPLAEFLDYDAATLAKEGISLDEEAIARLSIPLNVSNYIPYGGGFALLNQAGVKLATAGTRQGITKAANVINSAIAKKAGKAVGVGGKAVELGGSAAKGVAGVAKSARPLAVVAEVANTFARPGGMTPGMAAVTAATLAAPPILRGAGNLLEAAGKVAATKGAPLVERATKAVLDNVVTPAAEGAAVGGVMSLPLAALADDDNAASSIISGGVVFGAGIKGAEGAVRGTGQWTGTKLAEAYQRTAALPPTDSSPYGFAPLDAMHARNLGTLRQARPADANLINQVRETFREVATPDGAQSVEILLLRPEEAQQHLGLPGVKDAAGAFRRNVSRPDGRVVQEIVLVQDATGVLHEPGHLLQAIMPEAARQKLWSEIQAAYGPEKLNAFKATYEKLRNRNLPPKEQVQLPPEKVLEEVGAELLSNVLRGHGGGGLKPGLAKRAQTLAGGFLESSGLYSPEVTPTTVPKGYSPTQPLPGGVSPLGVGHSFQAAKVWERFLKDAGEKPAGAKPPPLLEVAPVAAPEAPAGVATTPVTPAPAAPVTPAPAAPVPPEVATTPVTPALPPVSPAAIEVTPVGEISIAPRRAQTPAAPRVAKEKTVGIANFGVNDYAGWTAAGEKLRAAGASPDVIAHFETLRDVALAQETRPVQLPYESITYQDPARPVRGKPRRTEREIGYMEEAMGALPENVRTLYTRQFVPSRTVIREGGGKLNVNVVGTSPSVILENAHLLGQEAVKSGLTHLLPVEVNEKGQLTAAGATKLWQSLIDYTQNQSHGRAGDGSKVVVPDNYKSYIPPETPGYTPKPLDPQMASYINLLLGVEPPKTTKAGSLKRVDVGGVTIRTPANVEAQWLAAANKRPATKSIFSDPEKSFFSDYGLGIAELNPLRDQFSQAGINLRDLLHEGIQELSLEHIKGPLVPLDSPMRPVNSPLVQAGMMPSPSRAEFMPMPPETVSPTLESIGALDGEGLLASAPTWKGGITGKAIDLGLSSTDRSQLARMMQLREEAAALRDAAKQADDLTTASYYGYKAQLFREAVEAATNTDSMGTWFKKRPPESPPPMPMPIAPHNVAPLLEQVRRAGPADFHSLAKSWPGGQEAKAIEVGQSLVDRGQLAKLKQLHDEARAARMEASQRQDFDTAIAMGSKAQFFREALEAATNTGSMAKKFEQTPPAFPPSFPGNTEFSIPAPTFQTTPVSSIRAQPLPAAPPANLNQVPVTTL